MRKKILVTVMAVLACSVAVPPANASAEKMPDIGAWGGFLQDWWPGNDDSYNYSDGYNDGYSYDSEDSKEDNYWYDVGEWEDDSDDEEDSWYDVSDWTVDDEDDDRPGYSDDEGEGELDIYDIAVNPKKKTLKKGKSFYISVVPADKSEWEGFTEEEWNDICEDNIESIEYSSTKKTVASVNSFNGKVKARKKGSALIKTTINLENGESVTFKTKVTVKK